MNERNYKVEYDVTNEDTDVLARYEIFHNSELCGMIEFRESEEYPEALEMITWFGPDDGCDDVEIFIADETSLRDKADLSAEFCYNHWMQSMRSAHLFAQAKKSIQITRE